MIQGTTAHFRFTLPCSYQEVTSAKITFWQEYNDGPSTDRPLPIVKVLAQCTTSENPNEICVSLTPEETSRFTVIRKAYTQMSATTIEGSVIANVPQELTVYPLYENDVPDDIVPTPGYDGIVFLDGGNI
jgi:hypothetical protein